MFHEFGHAHHGMLSSATYGRLASTNVLTDFVELPSQVSFAKNCVVFFTASF